jgi:hypothetical protein
MIPHLEKSFSNYRPDPSRPRTPPERLWLRLIKLWLSAVLAAFLVIRIFGSETAGHIFSRILSSHIR